MKIHKGDEVTVQTDTAVHQDPQTGIRQMTGTVVYIHPAFRFAVLEFKVLHGTFRETFTFTELSKAMKRRQGDYGHR